MKPIVMGDKVARVPIVQGGMGVGISRMKLAGAVAHEGGIGVISAAQIGYDDIDFEENPRKANLKVLKEHIKGAKVQSNGGLVAVNIMTVTKGYRDYVEAACDAEVDLIISGAGLPIHLPEYVKGTDVKIAPIVSSVKAAAVILKMWDRKLSTTADMVVIEGPEAGGHLGFTVEQLEKIEVLDYNSEIKGIIQVVQTYREKYGKEIPVILAGGIFDREDIQQALSLGADGVQMGTRFVTTVECDASDAYKQAYISAQQNTIGIVKSPVGMPGRAIFNVFTKKADQGQIQTLKCYQCLEGCNPKETPYCITKALINAVKGNMDEALVFSGSKAYQCTEIVTVKQLMEELVESP